MASGSAFSPGTWKKVAAGVAVTVGVATAAAGAAWWSPGPLGPTGADVAAPTVSLTAPADTATVSGSAVTVSASCSDNVACVGVQFKLNGSSLGSEDTSSPFSISWDSTAASNGSNTLSAVARDAAGNTQTAATITVTVSNGSQVANFWVDTDGGTCTRQSPAGAYSDAGACNRVNSAYLNASCGDAIVIKGGSYYGNNGNVINARSGDTACGSDVTIGEATGETAILASLSTTVNGAGQSLGGGTLTVASTTNFPTSGVIGLTASGVGRTCDYTGITPTTITGISGGGCAGTPADGAAVSLGHNTGTCATNTFNIDICGSHLKLTNLTLNATSVVHEGANNDTFLTMTTGYSLYIKGALNFLMQGGQVGPFNSNGGAGDGIVLQCEVCGVGTDADGTTGKVRPTVTIDGVYFTHILKTVDLGAHTDCFQSTVIGSLTIKNSIFNQCADRDIILGNENQFTHAATVTIENNFLMPQVDGPAVAFSIANGFPGTILIQHNTFDGAAIDLYTGMTFRGNAIGSFSSTLCTNMGGAGVAPVTFNVMGAGSTACGASNLVTGTSFGFIDDTADPPNLRIGPSSPLVDRGDPTGGNYPTTDIDGRARFLGSAPDAGAYEAG